MISKADFPAFFRFDVTQLAGRGGGAGGGVLYERPSFDQGERDQQPTD